MRVRGLPRDLSGRLAFRLAVLLSMALLPLGAIAIHAATELQRAAERAGERSLITLATDAVAGERALIESALASTRALESFVLELRGDPEGCSDLLRRHIDQAGVYSFAGFIGADGMMTCRSRGEAVDFAGTEGFEQLSAVPMTAITANTTGRVTGLPVIIVSRPVYADGGLAGFLSISISQRTLEIMAQRRLDDGPAAVVLVNQDGAILNRIPGDPALDLMPPPDRLAELVAARTSRVIHTPAQAEGTTVMALAELTPGRLYALAVWDRSAPVVGILDTRLLPRLFPALMWLACLAVALLAVNYLVLTHLKGLNGQMRRFALGQREPIAELPDSAPVEIRELHGTFRKMARLIARDEAERERALAEKTVLLKEVHHRVKNNLQLIASVINMQLRQVTDRSVRDVLHSIQQRVLGLASVHRELYDEDRLSRARVDRVVEGLLRRVAALGTGRGPELRLRLAPLVLDADRLVPLSFLLHEAVTNALKHLSGAPPGGAWIEVVLTHQPPTVAADRPEAPGDLVLRLRNPILTAAQRDGAARHALHDSGGLGSELIEAFATQLDGTCTQGERIDPDAGPVWELELRFPVPEELAPADLALNDSAPPPQA